MLDGTKWAGAHILAALSHVGLAITGLFFFVFGYKGFDAPFEKAAVLPWATIPCVRPETPTYQYLCDSLRY